MSNCCCCVLTDVATAPKTSRVLDGNAVLGRRAERYDWSLASCSLNDSNKMSHMHCVHGVVLSVLACCCGSLNVAEVCFCSGVCDSCGTCSDSRERAQTCLHHTFTLTEGTSCYRSCIGPRLQSERCRQQHAEINQTPRLSLSIDGSGVICGTRVTRSHLLNLNTNHLQLRAIAPVLHLQLSLNVISQLKKSEDLHFTFKIPSTDSLRDSSFISLPEIPVNQYTTRMSRHHWWFDMLNLP